MWRSSALRRPDSPGTISIQSRTQPGAGTIAVSSSAITSHQYVTTLDRIKDLTTDEDLDERPTDYAYKRALEVLRGAARELTLDFPRASPSVGPNRGLRITWSWDRKEVRLVCGGSENNKSYIYAESGAQNAIEYVVDGSRLADKLRWLTGEL